MANLIYADVVQMRAHNSAATLCPLALSLGMALHRPLDCSQAANLCKGGQPTWPYRSSMWTAYFHSSRMPRFFSLMHFSQTTSSCSFFGGGIANTLWAHESLGIQTGTRRLPPSELP